MKREDLLKALEVVKPGLASKEVIEQSTSFAFMGGNVVTYNDEISIRHPVPGLDITGAVRAEELYQLLNKIKKDEIEVEITESELRLKSGRAAAGLVLQQEIKLPLEEIGKQGSWSPLPEGFLPALQFTIPSAGKDLSNSILTCLFVRSDGLVESSDNFRITQFRASDKMPTKDFLLPASSAAHLVKYDLKQVSESKGWVHFRTDAGTIISCRTFEGAFPDTKNFFSVKGVKFDLPKTLDELLTRAQIFGASEQSTSGDEVEISLDKNRIKVRGQNEYGWFEETANVAYDKQPTTFSVDPAALKVIVTTVHSCTLSDNCLKFEGDRWQHVIALKAR